jgi:hypothetical protein
LIVLSAKVDRQLFLSFVFPLEETVGRNETAAARITPPQWTDNLLKSVGRSRPSREKSGFILAVARFDMKVLAKPNRVPRFGHL